MEHKVQRIVRQVVFFTDEFLRIAQNGRGQFHVAWLVYAVYVAERRCNGETRADFAQFGVSVVYVFWLGVQCGSVHVAVVDAIFFAAGAAQFNFQGHVDFCHARQVFAGNFDVFFQRLFRQVDHVRREQWLTGFSKVRFARFQQSVDPRQQFLRAVVSMQDYRHTVMLGHQMYVMRARDGAKNSSSLRLV